MWCRAMDANNLLHELELCRGGVLNEALDRPPNRPDRACGSRRLPTDCDARAGACATPVCRGIAVHRHAMLIGSASFPEECAP